MEWFRFYNEIVDDPKVARMSDRQFRCFSYLLCVANSSDERGSINLSIEEIAWRIRFTPEEVQDTISLLVELSIISNSENHYEFINWKKRQFPSDNVAERVKRFRSKSCNVTETLLKRKCNVIDTDTDTDTDNTRETSSLVLASEDVTPKLPPCPQKEIVRAYNEILGHVLPAVKEGLWNGKRAKSLQARWKENEKRQNIEFWTGLFRYVRDQCPFLVGKIPGAKGPFFADLDWIVRPVNMVKILEGKYEKR